MCLNSGIVSYCLSMLQWFFQIQNVGFRQSPDKVDEKMLIKEYNFPLLTLNHDKDVPVKVYLFIFSILFSPNVPALARIKLPHQKCKMAIAKCYIREC